MNLPNKLTVARIALIPIMVLLFYFDFYILSAVVFLIAAFTDMLDGKIARKRGLVTVFGKFFDPLADKLLNINAIVILAIKMNTSQLGWYAVFVAITTLIIIAREITITSFRALAASEGVVIAADKLGKAKTVVQDAAIVCLFLDEAPLLNGHFIGELIHWTGVVLLAGALVLTIVSGLNYLKSNKDIFNNR